MADYYVDKTHGSASDSNAGTSSSLPWLTIGKAAATLVAGDTVNILAGTYDERPSETTDGSAGLRIVYNASAGVKLRGMDISGDYVTISGFDLTNAGMSVQTFARTIDISGTIGVIVENNTIHDTTGPSVRYDGATSCTIRNNSVSYTGETNDVSGTPQTSLVISAGVNDQIKFSVQGGGAVTKTVSPGTWNNGNFSTLVNNMAIVLSGTGASFDSGAGLNCTLRSDTLGPTSSINIQSVANSAYAAFGWTIGSGSMQGHTAAFQGWTTPSTGILIENNSVSRVGDYVSGSTEDHIVIRNNSFGPADPNTAEHIDGWQSFGGNSFVLIEGNRFIFNNNPDNHVFLSQGSTDKNFIIRFNSTHRSNGGFDATRGSNTTTPGVYFYNNTLVNNGDEYGIETLDGIAGVNAGSSANNLARNNIFYNCDGPVYAGSIDKDYDLWFAGTGDPVETNDVNADPVFVNVAAADFRLRTGSPALATGGPLTTVAVADTGTGVSLVLTDASPFQDGWAGTQPDLIAVGTVTQVVQIVSINYSTNTINLANSITRNDGDPVWLYSKSDGERILYGAAPNIGAFQVAAGSDVLMGAELT